MTADLAESVHALLDRHRHGKPLTSGAVVAELLDGHRNYVDACLVCNGVEHLGQLRMAADHVKVAREQWDPTLAPVLSGRHLLLALAVDTDLGWSLLQSGIIMSLLGKWQARGTKEDSHRLVWDALNAAEFTAGRASGRGPRGHRGLG